MQYNPDITIVWGDGRTDGKPVYSVAFCGFISEEEELVCNAQVVRVFHGCQVNKQSFSLLLNLKKKLKMLFTRY